MTTKNTPIEFEEVHWKKSELKRVSMRDKSPVGSANIIGELKKLTKERKEFEENEFARSNKRLYEILAQAYGQYILAATTTKLFKETVKEIKTILVSEGSRVQSNTLAINLFVRFVFRSDRQRAHNYSRTLQAAYAKGIKPENLAQYIEDMGGVEVCKKDVTKSDKVKAKELTIAQTMPFVEEFIAGDALAPLAQLSVSRELVADSCNEEMTFLIGKADKNGKLQVLSVVPGFSKGAANWAKKQLAIYFAEHQALAEKTVKRNRKDTTVANAVAKVKKSNSATETVGELLAA